ncbi:MlaD family protein, partial [Nevskia sp.]|uniref:PqiB family protein n=1 Tax=Nevskia sp. TaxID=1929292 RepID=UPI0025CD0FDB
FRRVAVGQVVDSALDEDGKKITVKVFVEAPYDRFVTRNTRFWNAGGVDLAVSSEGLRLNTQSLATVLAGGIAFQAPDPNNPGERAPAEQSFELFSKIADALAPVDGPSVNALLVFRQSTRGLSVGTPVDFSGVVIGEVKSMQPQYDSVRQSFYTDVMIELFLERLGPAYKTLTALDSGEGRPPLKVLQRFINQGLHAQLRAGNLLTGQQYVALFFKPGSTKKVSISQDSMPEIPTAPGSLEEIQTQIESIVTKFDKIPFEALAGDLRSTLNNASSLLKTLDQEVAPQAKKTLAEAGAAIKSLDQNLASPEAPLQQDARRTLEQLNRTAASLRTLTEYLEQHPEALLRGRPVEVEPQPQPGKATDAPRN